MLHDPGQYCRMYWSVEQAFGFDVTELLQMELRSGHGKLREGTGVGIGQVPLAQVSLNWKSFAIGWPWHWV